MEMDPLRIPGLTKLGFSVLACNSALGICKSWGDAVSVAFVLVADAALVLLFVCLSELECRRRRRAGGAAAGSGRIKAAVWALTTLLTAMFTSGVTPMVPLAVGVVVFLCLRDVDHQARGGGRVDMDGQYYALVKVGFAVVTCNSAIDAYGARRDPASTAVVFFSYTAVVILMGLFLRAFAHAHADEQEQGQF